MLSRRIIRRIIPSLEMLKITHSQNSKNCVQSSIILNGSSIINIPHVLPYRFYAQQAKPEQTIADYEYVKKATDNDSVLIVDVREPDEVKEHGKIPNSINIPCNVTTILSTMAENQFQQTYNKPKPTENTEIIFYCMIGKRSGMAQQNAVNLGFKNVKNYLGSWTDWASKGQ